jgi:hypothetical protein
MEKHCFLPYAANKYITVVRIIRTTPINTAVVLRKPIKMIIVMESNYIFISSSC